ncbi:hypothetical protein CKA32_004731 [Geitlerinema sp. FC II]|nr:hypothetical protein CKA32_004731 [Geitlerinema sp. FC II]
MSFDRVHGSYFTLHYAGDRTEPQNSTAIEANLRFSYYDTVGN